MKHIIKELMGIVLTLILFISILSTITGSKIGIIIFLILMFDYLILKGNLIKNRIIGKNET